MENEAGRTLTEILGVLAIAGLLSVGGLIGYSQFMRHKNVDTILETLQHKIIEVNSAQANSQITDPNELNAFLQKFTTTVGAYQLSFHATMDGDGSFVSEVTHKDGSRIKGAFCRKLITKMAEQQFVADVDFSLKDEPQEDGTTANVNVSLHGKTVNLDDICGGQKGLME